jgi:tetratricopeptide (TPR) repeat protein
VNPLRALGCGIGLALVTLQAFRWAVARPYLIVGWLWYVGNLVPVIGIVQVGSQAHADRYTYIPMIGITLALAFGAIDWAGGRPRRQRALAAAGVASCAALAWVAFQQVGTWRNEETVFRRAVAVTGPNALAHRQLGRARHRVGDLPGAAEHYERALAIEPGFKEVQLEYGDVLRALGQVSQAREHYALALRLAEFEGDDAFAAVVRERLATPRGAAPAP